MSKRRRRTFTVAYKAEAVEMVRKAGKSVGEVARDLNRDPGAAK
jgi:transposase-like protein